MSHSSPIHRLPQFIETLSLEDYWWAIRTRWLLITICAIVGVTGAAVVVYFFPDRYASQAVVRFIPPQVAERFVQANEAMQAEQRVFAVSQVLGSTLTARKLIDSLGLYPELRRFMPVADLVPMFQADLHIDRTASGAAQPGRTLPSVRIGFTYSDPEKARKVVQQLVETIFEMNRRYRGEQSIGTTEFLTGQTEAVRQQLEELEGQINQLGLSDRVSGDHSWALRIQNLFNLEYRLGQIQTSLRNMNRDRGQKAQEVADLEAQIKRIPAQLTTMTVPPGYELIVLRIQMRVAQEAADAERARHVPDYPDRVAADKAVGSLQELVRKLEEREVENARQRRQAELTQQIDALRAEMAGLDTAIRNQQLEEVQFTRKAQEVRAEAFPSQSEDLDYMRLVREYASLKEFHLSLLRKQKESEVATEMERLGRGETVELVEPPSLALHAAQPNGIVKLILGLLGGIFAGMGYAVARYVIHPRIRQERHLSLWQDLSVLAEVPGFPKGTPKRCWWKRAAPVSAAVLVLLTLTSGCGWRPTATREACLRLGDECREKGDLAAASLYYRKALALNSRDGEAYEKLATVELALGEGEKAYASLTRASELLPDRPEVHIRLANLTYEIYFADPGRPRLLLREVEDLAEKLLRRWPEKAEGYRFQGLVLMERHRTDDAIEVMRRAVLKVGRDPALVAQLASAMYGKGSVEPAEELLRSLVAEQTHYGPAYDLLYLQLMERRQVEPAEGVLRSKWEAMSDLDSGLQYAAHLHAAGHTEALEAQLKAMATKLAAQPETLARIGDFWLNRGALDRAEALYRAGLDGRAGMRSLYVTRLVEVRMVRKDRNGALGLLDAELRRAPKDDALQACRASLDLDSTDTEEQNRARSQLEAILNRMPNSAFVRYHLGRAYLRLGDLVRAGEQFEKSIRLDPNYAPGWLSLAEVELDSGKIGQAQQRVAVLLKRAPGYGPARLLDARVRAANGQLEEAEQALKGISGEEGQTEVLLARAEIRLRRGDTKGASELLEQAQRSAPDDDRAVLALAQLEAGGGNVSGALSRLAAAMEHRPGSLTLRSAHATLTLQSGAFEQALKEFQALSQAHPQNVNFRLGSADAMAMSGRLADAAKEYQKAQSLEPRNAQPWVRYAAVLTAAGDAKRARDAYVEAIARDSNDPVALNNLSYLLARAGEQLDYALQLAQQAAQLQPQSLEIQDTLTYVYLRMGMKQQAMGMLERMIPRAAAEQKAELQRLRRQLQSGEPLLIARELEQARDRAAVRGGGARL